MKELAERELEPISSDGLERKTVILNKEFDIEMAENYLINLGFDLPPRELWSRKSEESNFIWAVKRERGSDILYTVVPQKTQDGRMIFSFEVQSYTGRKLNPPERRNNESWFHTFSEMFKNFAYDSSTN